ncbi:tRNA (adenosine(37)-N6)-threonylcarbamoyltransferase complex ATPase subunit type 1 TsaE [Paenarthrobacter sp. PH39-S1]|uniref:tRNA (adenosine(37)-N6)-threonylcarbamoyltransferase complex ATPase subunit type 1 TsaE n=1 Tax=Paenarthrobacter sp. PH39-S1 TaxID=3046204 RepID=UPI0024B8F3DD|nr:tRNA (adenosine(37)-N6)-threonylcarbamoyltransferase complex ATPase subunit type 1 TsaE [Paenarthrobacter sp. PH39-S1]MDJ0355830.1 tRNA (adenosine(37)-N6)-threonylcarbamoyltransferase complex ATPase subunit type 1 TsaE [Paenarthrobacter sp. PH39-S1]
MSRMWEFRVTTTEATQAIAERLGALLATGDLLVLSGELGAGKTTFTQGLGRGLGVRPGIISPTFVLVRIHPNLADGPNPGGPDLVHVDAYRLESAGEVDDIDLENTMDSAVTVVEWGTGRVEHLTESRLEIHLLRATGAGEGGAAPNEGGADDGADEPRLLRISAIGPRWNGADLSDLSPSGSDSRSGTGFASGTGRMPPPGAEPMD